MYTKNGCLLLQNDLNIILVIWADNLCLEFNVIKCHSMTFCRNRVLIEFDYLLCDCPLIPIDNTVKDLGIALNNELRFHVHIEVSRCKVFNWPSIE